MIDEFPTSHFLDALASASPTPGGGGAAAIMGAMGAALISMVANLTIGKKGYETVEAEMCALLAQSESLRTRLAGMVAQDASSFDSLIAAYKLPNFSNAEKATRSEVIQAGLKLATLAPLDCARACAEGVRLAERAVEHANTNVISDVGVAVLASCAALRSAALNININTPQIKDRGFAASTMRELEALLAECLPLAENVHSRVKAKLG